MQNISEVQRLANSILRIEGLDMVDRLKLHKAAGMLTRLETRVADLEKQQAAADERGEVTR